MGTNKTSFEITNPEDGEVYTINLTSLVSKVRELFLSKLRNDKEKKLWSKMSQSEQQREIDTCDDLSRSIVLAVANIVSAGKNPVIHALLDNYKVKAGEVTVTAKGIANDAAVLALNHVGRKSLKIIVVDEGQYDQSGDKTQAEPDQPSMLDDQQEAETDDGPSLADAMHDAIDNDTGNADTDGGSTDETAGEDDTANDLQPYEQGAGAAEHGLDHTHNPFDQESDDARHWHHGWKDWHDANPPAKDEPDTEQKEIGSEETQDESGLAELYDAVDTEGPADGPVIDHEQAEELDLVTIKKDGGQARVDGLGMDDCPFDGGTDAYEAWAKGWRATDDQIDGLMEEGAAARRNGESSKKCPWKAGSKENGYWMIGYNRAKSEEKD